MRRKQVPVVDVHTRCQERAEQRDAVISRYDAGIEAVMDEHKPYPSGDLRPGNDSRAVPFYCSQCRTNWPCKTFNDLRAIYGEAHGWEAARQPYLPLQLHRATTDERGEGGEGR